MEWTDDSVILDTRRHGETSIIVNLLSQQYGRFSGLVRGGASKNKRAIIQPGNKVLTRWRARLAEHLGTFECELIDAHASCYLNEPILLSAMNSACSIISSTLPEREPHQAIYKGFIILLESLHKSNWATIYVKWEVGVLGELGFGLDLTTCAATGTNDNLTHVSPKSGKAVCQSAARPYLDKLLPLPNFLVNGGNGKEADILAGLELTGYFFYHYVLAENGKKQPNARIRFVQNLNKLYSRYC